MKAQIPSSKSQVRDTRQAILDTLKRAGPQPAHTLAQRFNVTAMAVRQHLYILQKEGMVTARSEPSGRGRPIKIWELTADAQRLFPEAHQALLVDLLGHMRAQFGEQGLTGIIDRHSEAQFEAYRLALADALTLEARIKGLARLRSEEGYMAEIQRDGKDWLLIENHCPICSAARTCTRLCANELAVFTRVLGPGACVSREEYQMDGARRCTYRVSEAARIKAS